MYKICAQTVNEYVDKMLKICVIYSTNSIANIHIGLHNCGKVRLIPNLVYTSTHRFCTHFLRILHLLYSDLYLFSTGPIIKTTNFIKYI